MNYNFKKNFYYLILEYILKFLISFIISLKIAKELGVENYGELNYLLSLIAIIISISNFGMENLLITKMITLEPEEKKQIMNQAIVFQIIIYIVITPGVMIFIKKSSIYIYLLFLGYLFSLLKNLKCFFISIGKSYITSKLELLSLIIGSIFKLYFIFYIKIEKNLSNYILIITLIEVISGAMYLFRYIQINKKMRILNIKLNNKIIYQLIKESLPLFISALSVNLYMRIDQLMLLKMLSSYELGIYSGVIKLTEIWYFIPNIIYVLFIPKIAFLRKNSIVKSNEYIKKILSLLIFFSIAIFLMYQICSNFLVRLTLGEEFIEAVKILKLYSFLIVINYFGTFRGKLMILEEKQKYLAIIGGIGIFINIILNYLLIPKFKIEGAVFASIISQLFTNHIILYFFKETKPIFYLQQKSINGIFNLRKNLSIIKE